MITLIIFLLILCSILLVTVVLLQSSKGNGLAGPIGGSSVTMAFGVRRTSDLLTRATTVLAAILMVGCIVVNLMITNTGTVDESIIQKNAGQQQQMPPPNTAPPIDNNQPPANNQDQQQQNTNPDQQQQNINPDQQQQNNNTQEKSIDQAPPPPAEK